jgi:ankyrin repeat protein
MHACKRQSDAVVDYLLSVGVDVNKRAPRGFSAIHQAVKDRYFAGVQKLARHGAALDEPDIIVRV